METWQRTLVIRIGLLGTQELIGTREVKLDVVNVRLGRLKQYMEPRLAARLPRRLLLTMLPAPMSSGRLVSLGWYTWKQSTRRARNGDQEPGHLRARAASLEPGRRAARERRHYRTYWLATTGRVGRPHLAGVGAIWLDGKVYFVSGASTRKSRDLATKPECALSVSLIDVDLVVEGKAVKVTDPKTLDRIARKYAAGGWPAEVRDGALVARYSAPSAGPPPWDVHESGPRRGDRCRLGRAARRHGVAIRPGLSPTDRTGRADANVSSHPTRRTTT